MRENYARRPKYGPHLEGIGKKIQSQLEKLGLVPDYAFDSRRHQERFYTAPCRDRAGNRVIFKMRTEDHRITRAFFRREIRINRQFLKCGGCRPQMAVPRYIAGDSARAPEWMVYEFIPGREAGDFYNGLFSDKVEGFPLKSLVAAMKDIGDLSSVLENGIRLHRESFSDHIRAYLGYCQRLRPFFSGAEIKQAEKILQSGRALLDRASTVVTHGDFHPGNIVITDKKRIAIIDWYAVRIDNPAFDLAFLYLEISDQALRRKLLQTFLREAVSDHDGFRELFRLDVLRLVPQKIGVFYDALSAKDPGRAEYYSRLTPSGIAKLEHDLEAFRIALAGEDFS